MAFSDILVNLTHNCSVAMKLFLPFILFFTVAQSVSSLNAQTMSVANQDEKIQKVIEAFQDAILQKDSTLFRTLFFHDAVPFVGMMSETTEWSIKKDYQDFQGLATSTSEQFISEICASPKQHREDFFDVQVQTDGVIANVTFDYAFYSGESMMQWGSEKWNLVFVEGEWLITDVIFSIRFPDIEQFPY